jgi:hypothetical protein
MGPSSWSHSPFMTCEEWGSTLLNELGFNSEKMPRTRGRAFIAQFVGLVGQRVYPTGQAGLAGLGRPTAVELKAESG